MKEHIGLFEAISTQRAIRRFRSDPVPAEAINQIIGAATKAPSAGNVQPWNFIVISDPVMKAEVSRIYRESWLEIFGDTPRPDEAGPYREARYLAQHMHEVPVIILICIDHQKAGWSPTISADIVRNRYAASAWPSVQNLLLAARALGLGTCLTTTHLAQEQKIKDLLKIPLHVETVALTPVGYPMGSFGPTKRKTVSEVLFYDYWGNLKDSYNQRPVGNKVT